MVRKIWPVVLAGIALYFASTSLSALPGSTETDRPPSYSHADAVRARSLLKLAGDEKPQKCRKGICTSYSDVCVPGCDPPDENNTIHGCSSCYSTKSVCVAWEEVCE